MIYAVLLVYKEFWSGNATKDSSDSKPGEGGCAGGYICKFPNMAEASMYLKPKEESFSTFLYNQEKGEVCGRTKESWGEYRIQNVPWRFLA